MYYKSENGYEGTFKKGCFLGLKHYDLTIFKDGKMVYHCTYSEPLTEDGFHKEVDEFPEFLKRLMKEKGKGEAYNVLGHPEIKERNQKTEYSE